MKTVYVEDVLEVLHKYGELVFATDLSKYREMQDEIANLPKAPDNTDLVLNKIRAEILEEKECAYADFERYKVEYLWQDWEDAYDSVPQDDFRFGMERCIDIIDKYKVERDKE